MGSVSYEKSLLWNHLEGEHIDKFSFEKDRYWAITDPFNYPYKMSDKKVSDN